MTRSRATLILLVLLSTISVASLAIATASAIRTNNWNGLAMTGVSAGLTLGLLAAHLLRWRWSAEAAVLMTAVLTIVATPDSYVRSTLLITPLIPTVIAAIVLSPRWSLGSYAALMLGIAAKVAMSPGNTGQLTQALGPTFTPLNLLLSGGVAGGIALASAVARHAQYIAETNAARVREEGQRAAERSQELIQANELAQTQIAQQQQLLELVASLETPVTPLAENVLFAPIVGHVDSRRAQTITERLLDVVNEQRARTIILDISGVSVIDTGVAKALLGAVQAIRLLGCEVLLTGISANVAMTLTQLGITMEGVQTVRTPQEALAMLRNRPARQSALSAHSQPSAPAPRHPHQS
jgi:anti-anti-sigma regulatory factor